MSNVKLKICGVCDEAEAELLASKNIDYIGLNFISDSKRSIDLDRAIKIAAIIRKSNSKIVGLFKNHPITYVNKVCRELALDYAQLNGLETSTFALEVTAPIIRTIAVSPSDDAEHILEYIQSYPSKYFILDRFKQGEGNLVDLNLARQIITTTDRQIFLAGGINENNMSAILRQVNPFGIDIASGVRSQEKLDQFKIDSIINIITESKLPSHV